MTGIGRRDVLVVGGGAVGLASAWRLAQRGLAVTVVDPAPGSGASGVAAGMLAPVTEARPGEEDLLRLNLASWSRWPDFAAEIEAAAADLPPTGSPGAGGSGELGTPAAGESAPVGGVPGADEAGPARPAGGAPGAGWSPAAGAPIIGYRADGTLIAALDADDRAALDDLVARQRSLGLEVTTLRGREARALEPALAPGVRAGALAAGERSVDPAALVAALHRLTEAAGVATVAATVERVVLDGAGDRVTGVALAGGEVLDARWVVLAAGCWTGTIDGLPAAARLPVRPVKGQILTLRQPPGDPLLTRTVRALVRGSSVYLVPRADGRVVVGATVEERGWDTRVTAGGAYELLRDALALVPGLDDAELAGVRSGLRPGSPDDRPMIGPTALDGLVAATGHHRNGILLTPVTAEAVAAAVTGEPVPAQVVACDPRRFSGAGMALGARR